MSATTPVPADQPSQEEQARSEAAKALQTALDRRDNGGSAPR